ncbi:MAG: PAS domain S-box protein, partial [Geobacteraceae bacterium]|nr:PAS domain S-box protein [Geobacteraceae bacterium]
MNQNSPHADDFSELRPRAEMHLQKNHRKNPDLSSSPEELLRLIHELEVHQIELEMQQNELNLMRDELEKTLQRYTDIYDFAPLGYMTIARNSSILEVNLMAAKMLGTERARLRNKKLANFITPE